LFQDPQESQIDWHRFTKGKNCTSSLRRRFAASKGIRWTNPYKLFDVCRRSTNHRRSSKCEDRESNPIFNWKLVPGFSNIWF